MGRPNGTAAALQLCTNYHFSLVFVHFIKSTKKSWHGSDPPPLLAQPGFQKHLSLQPLPNSILYHFVCRFLPNYLSTSALGAAAFISACVEVSPINCNFTQTNFMHLHIFPQLQLYRHSATGQILL